LDPFKEISSSLSDVHNDKKTEKEYATINAGLSQIQQQLGTLQNAVNSLSAQIGIEQFELSNLLITTTLNQYIGLVQVQWIRPCQRASVLPENSGSI